MSTVEISEETKFRLEATLEKMREDKGKLEDKLDKVTMKLNGDIISLEENINTIKSLLVTSE